MGHQCSGGCTEEFLLADPIVPEPDRDSIMDTDIQGLCRVDTQTCFLNKQ